jgi:hypothetical protein
VGPVGAPRVVVGSAAGSWERGARAGGSVRTHL